MDFGGVSLENQDLAKALENEICEGSAHVHAELARVAKACAKFDEIGGWCSGGVRSFPHWLTVNAGFDTHTGEELLRVGQALNKLPKIAEAFAAGQLSFDKVRQVTRVATPATDHIMLEIAQGSPATNSNGYAAPYVAPPKPMRRSKQTSTSACAGCGLAGTTTA